MTSETKKITLLIFFVLFSTMIGFYNRVQSTLTASAKVSVLPKPSIMVIPINGMISASGSEWNASIVDTIIHQLEEAKETKSVKGVILRVNSPGGTVGASQEIYDAIIRFKQDTNKPVVASIMDICASGAYWITLATDSIFSHPGSLVGSLGVITQTMDLTKVPEEYAVNVKTYKSGKYKDILNPWRSSTKEEELIIQTMLNSVHDQFKEALKKSKDIDSKKLDNLADGRIFSGADAHQEGLVDQIGSFYDAVQYTASLAEISDPNIMYPNQGVKDWIQSFRVMLMEYMPFPKSIMGMNQYQIM